MINDHELLAALIRLIIGIVEREGLRGELGTSVTAIRVVRICLIDGDEANQHVYRQERWDKSASTRCAPQSTPLRLLLRHNRPLPALSRLLPPLTSPSRALGTLAKLTSVTEITGWFSGLNGVTVYRGFRNLSRNLESTTSSVK